MLYIPKPTPAGTAKRQNNTAPATDQLGSATRWASHKAYATVQGMKRGRSRAPSIVRLESEANAVARLPVDHSASFSAPSGRNSTRATTAANMDATALASRRPCTQSIDMAELGRPHATPGVSSSAQERPRVRFAGLASNARNLAGSSTDSRLWSDEEAAQLAQMCMRFWTSGRTVDYQQLARALQRSRADVRIMVQLMLQEHVLCAHKSHWVASDEFIRAWASIEFPNCPVLDPQGAARRPSTGLGSLGRCLSILRCRSLGEDSSLVSDRLVPSGSSIIMKSSPSPPEKISKLPGMTVEESGEPTAATIDTDPIMAKDMETVDELAARSTKEAATCTADITFQPPVSGQINPGAVPATSRGSTKTLRLRRMQERRKQRPKSLLKKTAPAVVGPPLTFTLPEPDQQPVNPNGAVSYSSDILGMGSALAAFDADAQDTELSPDQSKDTYDLNRLDGDIDIEFFDVTAPCRRLIRDFVEGYVEKHFDIFYYRAIKPDVAARLCTPFPPGDNAGLADDATMNAIETELLQYEALNTLTGRGQEPVDVENADLHFHMRFSRAVQKCNIYETDANWHSANSYATTVLNRVVEDVHYLAFEGIGSASRVSVCSDGAPIQRMQIDGMAGRMNTYKRMYCTGIVASQLTTRFVQRNGRDVFLGRVARCGFRPVPTAPEYDDGLGEDELEKAMEHAWSDVSIRAELHGLIMALVPYTTTESTMLMMQRAIEVYNKTIVSYLAGIRGGLDGAFGAPLEGQGISPQVLDPIREGNGAVSVAQISKLAQWLADLWFDRLKRGLLRALMADCQLRPVSLASVRRWIAEDRAPGGKGIDFVLNTRLYTYLKHLRVRMNEAKWLYASAAATLRVIERAKERLTTPHLLDHVSVSRCAEQFRAQIANELRLDSPVGPAKARMPELDISPLEAAILGRTGDTSSAMSHDSPENLARELEESRMRLDQLALTAASAPPPPLVIPLSPKATESSRVDSRLEFLELEVASIRREMHGVADMRRDVSAILAMLRGQPAR